jgi:hypothetical protein
MLVPFLAQPGEVIYRISRENMEGEPYKGSNVFNSQSLGSREALAIRRS